ncbi:hypothetical protein [Rhodococcus sp. IEGM 1318]|uniref:hypothetical protein n=1 Tax=Rhodococcus sp. IEGM 1318 TaxID=3082226 RepID=UPI0029529969|nr:hypothetical protein [Rhodococcus sp. IEGM 1318]MDV8009374.1 hypothetical protein [Rhodococcus sp. IEGM 1318]
MLNSTSEVRTHIESPGMTAPASRAVLVESLAEFGRSAERYVVVPTVRVNK